MDSLELRMAGSDQANRALLEQLMKLNQDIKVRTFYFLKINTGGPRYPRAFYLQIHLFTNVKLDQKFHTFSQKVSFYL